MHTVADFDVNTLAVSNYPDLVRLKRHVIFDGSVEKLTVDDVIDSCVKKQLTSMRNGVDNHLEKMTSLGWVHTSSFSLSIVFQNLLYFYTYLSLVCSFIFPLKHKLLHA